MSMVIDIIFWFSLACLIASSLVALYSYSYRRGYEHGHHCGISLGIFKAHENINKKKIKEQNKRDALKWMN